MFNTYCVACHQQSGLGLAGQFPPLVGSVWVLAGGPNRFILQVQGLSMIDSNIQEGDYVVIQKQEEASNGDRVVAMIDNDVTLKRFYREKDHIRLEPENSTMAPILVDSTQQAQILGVLVGVLRKC